MERTTPPSTKKKVIIEERKYHARAIETIFNQIKDEKQNQQIYQRIEEQFNENLFIQNKEYRTMLGVTESTPTRDADTATAILHVMTEGKKLAHIAGAAHLFLDFKGESLCAQLALRKPEHWNLERRTIGHTTYQLPRPLRTPGLEQESYGHGIATNSG